MMMLSRHTGESFDDVIQNIQQSISDILTTPIGSRIMRREYGSLLIELIDQPLHDTLLLKIYSAVYTALYTWEKRINIEHIQIQNITKCSLDLILEATFVFTEQKINLNIPLKMGAIS